MKNGLTSIKFAILAADTVLFSIRDGELVVRLIAVNRPPYFINKFGLPGGLLLEKETAEEAALRNVETKARIQASKIYAEQLCTFSAINRDPRGRVVAVAYLALVPWEKLSTSEKSDEDGARWQPVTRAIKLAYDHDEILSVAIKRLRSRMKYTTLLSKIMPREFTLSELQEVYENVLKRKLDKRNFRKKIQSIKILTELSHKRTGLASRPANLYRFKTNEVREIEIL